MRLQRTSFRYLSDTLSRMIIVNIKGGLGNQMFQYALGRKLALQNNDELKLDIAQVSNTNVADTYRPFRLRAFNISATEAAGKDSERFRYPYGKVSWALEKFRTKILRQFNTGFEPAILQKKGNIYLDGYFQSPKYFDDIRDVLLQDFTLKAALGTDAATFADMMDGNAVSLHVRRGDYVSNPKVQKLYGSCSLAYYKAAIEEIKKEILTPVWFIFSDDIAWVKQNLPLPDSSVFIEGKEITDAEELLLMSHCAHNVIANSSFSWWGAWLNRNPEKTVIAPTPWFDYDPDFTSDILPTTWKQLPKQ
jgi:hypothetical protein